MNSKFRDFFISFTAATICTISSANVLPANAQTVSIEPVVLSGATAPGTGGQTFTLFNAPVLNGPGQVAFRAFITGDPALRIGFWAGSAGDLTLIARNGAQAAGTGGRTFFLNTTAPFLDASGDGAFGARLNDLARGIWKTSNGGLNLVALQGDAAPGTEVENFQFFFTPLFNPSSQVAFLARLDSNEAGIWMQSAGDLAFVARKGGVAPGTDGETFRGVGFPVLNPAGQVAFAGQLNNFDRGIWAGSAGSLNLVSRQGDEAPGTGGLDFQAYSNPVLNGSGGMAFRAFLDTGVFPLDDFGIWLKNGDDLAIVVRQGDDAQGVVGRTFRLFTEPVLSGSGQLAFFGFLDISDAGDELSDVGIWVGDTTGLSLVAREGTDAPGTTGGVTFRQNSVPFSTKPFDPPYMNAHGFVAFRADLDSGVFLDHGIWVGRKDHLALVVRRLDMLEVAPGDMRTVRGAQIFRFGFNSGNEDGRRSVFNDSCQVAFQAGFTDNTSGIFVASVGFSPVAVELINDLIVTVTGLALNNGAENALLDKLNGALQKLLDENKSNDGAASNLLKDFLAIVEAHRSKKISDDDADSLTAAAEEIFSFLACV